MLRRLEELHQRGGGRWVLGGGADAGLHDHVALQILRERAEQLDALGGQDFADRQRADLRIAARDRFADLNARRLRDALLFDRVGDTEAVEQADEIDYALARLGVGDR